MASVTLAQLRLRVREKADLEDDSRFVDDAELDGYLNRALWALDDLLHSLWEDYFVTTATLTASGATLTLPADFFKLLRVDCLGPGSRWVALRPYALVERNGLRNLPALTVATVGSARYRLHAKRLEFLPSLPTGTTLEVAYYPENAKLVLATDTRDYPNGWEEWAVTYAAMQALIKEERDYSGLEKLHAMEDARVRASAPVRDETPPPLTQEDDGDGIAPWRRF